MLKNLDVALAMLFWVALIVLSIAAVVRRACGKTKAYGQLSAVPESWIRWVHGESSKK